MLRLRNILPTESLKAVLNFMKVEEILEVPHSRNSHRSIVSTASNLDGKVFRVVKLIDSTLVIRLK